MDKKVTAVLVNYKIKWDNLFAGKNSTQQGSRSQAGIIGGVVGGVVAALALLVCLLTTVCCLVRNNCCCAPVVKEENAGTERERERGGDRGEERRGRERKKERVVGCTWARNFFYPFHSTCHYYQCSLSLYFQIYKIYIMLLACLQTLFVQVVR